MLYKVISRVRHDGETYEIGDHIRDLSEEAAKALLEAGAIIRADAPEVAQQVKSDVVTVEAQVAEDVATARAAEAPAAPAPLDGSSLAAQVRANAASDLAANDQLAATPAEPVAGQPSADDVAATAAEVK